MKKYLKLKFFLFCLLGLIAVQNNIKAQPQNYVVDDTSSSIIYGGSWSIGQWSGYYNNTAHYTANAGDSAQYTFTGVGIKWIAATNTDHGIAKVYIDNVYQTTVDLYSSSSQLQQVIYADTGLSIGQHTIKIVCTGNENPNSTASFIDIDAFDVANPVVDDTSSSIAYGGSWQIGQWSGYYNNTAHYTANAGDSAQYTFTGVGIKWIAATNTDHGIATVYIDGVYQTTVDLYSSSSQLQQVIYADTVLSAGQHTIKIVCTGTKDSNSTASFIDIDAFYVVNNYTIINMSNTDIIMWYDCDDGTAINTRPDNGWWPLNPEYPNDPSPATCDTNTQYRTTTSLLGTYQSQDSTVIKQHAYWIKALGCNVIACDLTNSGPSGQGSSYWDGVNKAFELQLKNLPQITEFEAPSVYPVIRLTGTNYSNLTLMLDDMYALYQQYPAKWYKLDDGTANKDKPFIEIFADWSLLNQWITSGIPIQDSRFNIRYSNGYLLSQPAITQLDNNNIHKIPGNIPYWLFVENTQDPLKGYGYYEPVYKEMPYASGEGVEQMITWASVCISDTDWDGLRNTVDSETPIVRYTEPVFNLKPKVLMACRFNYPIAWLSQPQEGVSRNKSTHIEPNVDWRFLEFNNVADELYSVKNYGKVAPPTPVIESFNSAQDILQIKLDGFPLEYLISNNENFNGAQWTFLNVGKGGIELGTKVVDDASGRVMYGGSWSIGQWSGYYDNTVRYTANAGDSAQYTFTGVGIKWIAATNTDHGIAKVYIDNVYQTTVDLYSLSSQLQQVIYADTGLSIGQHTIKIVCTGTKNPNSTASFIDVDAFDVANPIDINKEIYIQTRNSFGVSPVDSTKINSTWLRTDDTSSSIIYGGGWSIGQLSGYYNNTAHYTANAGDSAQYTFTGVGIKWIAATNSDHGIAKVYIDSVYQTTVDLYSSSSQLQQVIYADTVLSTGQHTIKIVCTGTKDSNSTASFIDVDAFDVENILLTSVSSVTSVKTVDPGVPHNFELSQNYPNPFNPTTEIKYSIPKSGIVTLKVYNLLGQEVATLVNQEQKSGNYIVNFDASKLASGVYMYRIQSGNFSLTKKMLLLK